METAEQAEMKTSDIVTFYKFGNVDMKTLTLIHFPPINIITHFIPLAQAHTFHTITDLLFTICATGVLKLSQLKVHFTQMKISSQRESSQLQTMNQLSLISLTSHTRKHNFQTYFRGSGSDIDHFAPTCTWPMFCVIPECHINKQEQTSSEQSMFSYINTILQYSSITYLYTCALVKNIF